MHRLADKVALISGAARGMGASEARLFAKEGAEVVLGDILVDDATKVVEEIRMNGGEAISVRLDVTKETNWKDAIATTIRQFGKLNVLVNNAGISGVRARVENTTLHDWNRVMEVNATGVFLGTKMGIPAIRQSGGGSIINVSSVLGLVGSHTGSPEYVTSKGAIRLFTKMVALQYAKEGIRVNSVHPGSIITPMTEQAYSDPELSRSLVSRTPMGRWGKPDEVAYGVLYLASDESSFVTGAELVIDGGWSAQ